jgi:hypothetical protein
MTDYRTMLSGMAALHAAAATTVVAITICSLEVALRAGERVTGTRLRQPAAASFGPGMAEMPMLRLAEGYAEWVRGFAALPRVSALIFLGELDRFRGRRVAPPA